MSYNKTLGRFGESAAIKLLTKQGYSIIATNYRSRFGEIDIIAKKDSTLYFIEVKTRSSLAMGQPYEAINPVKIWRLKRVATEFLLKNSFKDYTLNIGVISIISSDGIIKDIIFFENIEQ